MSTRLERWSQPADDAGRGAVAAIAAVVAIGLFAGSWGLLHLGFFTHHPVKDTPVYEQYGDAIVSGRVPYRDFRPEYPPAALPTFVPAAAGAPSSRTYERRFEWTMLVCGIAMVALMAVAMNALDTAPGRLSAGLVVAGLSPLLIGPVMLSRFDLWPAALTAAALAAVASGRLRLGSGVVGLGFAAKLYPVLLLPPVLLWAWRRRGRREALVCAGVFAAVAVACFLPFAIVAPEGVWGSVFRQGNRPLQIESLGAAILLAAHHLFGLGLTMRSSHGSQNLAGTLPDAIAALQSVLQAAVVVGVWVWFARGASSRERLVRACAASVVAFVALGKVLSPQFLIWLIPLVPLVRGRRGLAATGLFALAAILTQTWFPYRYWVFALHFDQVASWTVLVRDLVLVALLAVLLAPATRLRRVRGSPRTT